MFGELRLGVGLVVRLYGVSVGSFAISNLCRHHLLCYSRCRSNVYFDRSKLWTCEFMRPGCLIGLCAVHLFTNVHVYGETLGYSYVCNALSVWGVLTDIVIGIFGLAA